MIFFCSKKKMCMKKHTHYTRSAKAAPEKLRKNSNLFCCFSLHFRTLQAANTKSQSYFNVQRYYKPFGLSEGPQGGDKRI